MGTGAGHENGCMSRECVMFLLCRLYSFASAFMYFSVCVRVHGCGLVGKFLKGVRAPLAHIKQLLWACCARVKHLKNKSY